VAAPLATHEECKVGVAVPKLQMAELGDMNITNAGRTEVSKGDRVDASTNLYVPDSEKAIFDLYCVGYGEGSAKSVPFVHTVWLMGPRGEVVRIRSVFDDGAMLNAIDAGVFETVKGRLTGLTKSLKILRMADGRLVPSLGVWTGEVEVKGLRRGGSFEVFDSGGAWALLFGKPLLTAFDAFHGYGLDEVHIPSVDGTWVTLANQYFSAGMQIVSEPFIGFTTDIKQRTGLIPGSLGSVAISPLVPPAPLTSTGAVRRTAEERLAWRASQGLPPTKSRSERRLRGWMRRLKAKKGGVELEGGDDLQEGAVDITTFFGGHGGEPEEHWSSIWVVDEVAEGDYGDPGIEQPMLAKTFEPSVLTRLTEPFLPA